MDIPEKLGFTTTHGESNSCSCEGCFEHIFCLGFNASLCCRIESLHVLAPSGPDDRAKHRLEPPYDTRPNALLGVARVDEGSRRTQDRTGRYALLLDDRFVVGVERCTAAGQAQRGIFSAVRRRMRTNQSLRCQVIFCVRRLRKQWSVVSCRCSVVMAISKTSFPRFAPSLFPETGVPASAKMPAPTGFFVADDLPFFSTNTENFFITDVSACRGACRFAPTASCGACRALLVMSP